MERNTVTSTRKEIQSSTPGSNTVTNNIRKEIQSSRPGKTAVLQGRESTATRLDHVVFKARGHSPLYSSGTPAYGRMPSTSKLGFFTSVRAFWKLLH